MNPQLLKDPVVLICVGIIFIGFVVLLWAIGKFRTLGSDSAKTDSLDDLIPTTPNLPDIEFRPSERLTPASAPSPAMAVSKEVADRLESMTQRLTEMQSVLMKQSASASAQSSTAGNAGVGQGFSPETIEKLLKIIGNVIQQVDVLQKSIEPNK